MANEGLEDREVAGRLLQGDREALRTVYRAYKDDLLTVAMALLCHIHEAEDCVHDVFVQFAAHPGHWHVNTNLRGYLMRCVANRAKNWLKREHVRAKGQRDPDEALQGPATPVGSLIATEQARQVFEAMAELPLEQREVVTLHLHADLTFQQIADQLGLSINTIQSRYRYGIEKLRSLL